MVVAALNDASRTVIGDPRKGEYKVAVRFPQLKEALEFARQLAILGIIPTTTIRHDEVSGAPLFSAVNIWAKEDQRNLFEGFRSKLDEPQRQQFNDLVLARGPVPDDVVERMVKARERDWSPAKTAEKMNAQGVMAGMGGIRWTPKKVRDALREYDRRLKAIVAGA